MDMSTRIADLAAPAARAAGLVVDGVDVAAAGKRTRVTITLDLPETEIGSASLDAIAVASRGISLALDADDTIPTAYVLEVSTPGVSRPLTERRHFLRARSRKVSLDLIGGAHADGRLADVDGDDLVLEAVVGHARIPLADVIRGEIVVELKRTDGTDGH